MGETTVTEGAGRNRRLTALVAALFLCAGLYFLSLAALGEDGQFSGDRREMVRDDIERRGVRDERVLQAMGTVPRHLFVPEKLRAQAYWDTPLPIGMGQTISQPYVVALMTETLNLEEGEKVLEIGTGSGYQAAVLAEITGHVFSIEIIPELAEKARATLESAGYEAVKVRTGDGYYGWPEEAPFDAVIITAAANHIPPPLIDQLKIGGRLILPLGRTTHVQVLTLVTKSADKVEARQMSGVRFVPMVGEAQKPSPAAAEPK